MTTGGRAWLLVKKVIRKKFGKPKKRKRGLLSKKHYKEGVGRSEEEEQEKEKSCSQPPEEASLDTPAWRQGKIETSSQGSGPRKPGPLAFLLFSLYRFINSKDVNVD